MLRAATAAASHIYISSLVAAAAAALAAYNCAAAAAADHYTRAPAAGIKLRGRFAERAAGAIPKTRAHRIAAATLCVIFLSRVMLWTDLDLFHRLIAGFRIFIQDQEMHIAFPIRFVHFSRPGRRSCSPDVFE